MNADVPDPLTSIHTVMSQNNRWDRIKSDLKPFRHDLNSQQLEYVFYDGEGSFPAGNELDLLILVQQIIQDKIQTTWTVAKSPCIYL